MLIKKGFALANPFFIYAYKFDSLLKKSTTKNKMKLKTPNTAINISFKLFIFL